MSREFTEKSHKFFIVKSHFFHHEIESIMKSRLWCIWFWKVKSYSEILELLKSNSRWFIWSKKGSWFAYQIYVHRDCFDVEPMVFARNFHFCTHFHPHSTYVTYIWAAKNIKTTYASTYLGLFLCISNESSCREELLDTPARALSYRSCYISIFVFESIKSFSPFRCIPSWMSFLYSSLSTFKISCILLVYSS